MNRQRYLWAGLLTAVCVATGVFFILHWLNSSSPPVGPPEVPSARERQAIPVPKIPFTDITKPAGITFTHTNAATPQKLLPETMGAGVAFLDYDGDGKQDLLFVNSCPWPGHGKERPTAALYRNKGDGTFEDVTKGSGLDVSFYGMGVCVGDYDNDGFPDVFISAVGKHRLFHNEAGKGFKDVTDEAAVGGGGELPGVAAKEFMEWEKPPIPFGSSATFLDYDGDGKLDLFVCHYVTWSPKIDLKISSTLKGTARAYGQPKDFEGAQCALYRNTDGKHFEDVTAKAGVRVVQKEGVGEKDRERSVAKALGVILCDPDEDGWPDLVVANDTVRNFFYHNIPGPDGTRRFEEIAYPIGLGYAESGARGGMGTDWGEYQPGRSAVIIANFANEPTTFMRLDKREPLAFSDNALRVGIWGPSRIPLKFGAFFFDCDLDGRLDLLTCNGHIEPGITTIQPSQDYAQKAQLFWNTGDPQRVFEEATADAVGADLFKPMVGRGSAYADIDGDGDLDIVLTANGGPARLLRNDCKLGHHWARVVLTGDGMKSNKSAIGAQVTIEAGGKTMRRQIAGGRGYLSQSELPLTVGLGDTTKVDRVTVRWPGEDGGTEEWTDLAADKVHPLSQGTGKRR